MMQWPRESGHCGNNTHGTQTLVALPSSLTRPFPRGPSWFPQIWPETCPPHFFLLISDKRSTTGLPVGSIIGIALGVLIGVALMATLAYFLLCTRTGRYDGIFHKLILSHTWHLGRKEMPPDLGFSLTLPGYLNAPGFSLSFCLPPSWSAANLGASFIASSVIN